MNTSARKERLIHWIQDLEDETTLERLEMVYNIGSEWSNIVSPFEKEQIQKGLKDMKAGRVHSHSEVRESIASYIKQYSK